MKDLDRLAERKHYHHRIIQRDGELAFIAGSPALVDELADALLEADTGVREINRHQLELKVSA